MITDIFSRRYAERTLWQDFGPKEKALLVQGFRIAGEQLYPYYSDGGHVIETAKKRWESIGDRLSMELGLDKLSNPVMSYKQPFNGQEVMRYHTFSSFDICKNFLLAALTKNETADEYIKNRLSLIEIAFADKAKELADADAKLETEITEALRQRENRPRAMYVPGDIGVGMRLTHKKKKDAFAASVDELNERFRQAGMPLNYHNGLVQIADDMVIEAEIERPFWAIVSDGRWKNVETEMKQALDVRDAGGPDPGVYAAKALESTIKIVCDIKGWTTGKEKGAQNYLDALASNKNAFIADWEKISLEGFFRNVRNPVSHGAGSAPLQKLSTPQTAWAIGFCMNWIKSLVTRI